MDKTERELRDLLAARKLASWPNEAQWVAVWNAANAKGYTGGISDAVYHVAPELLDSEWVKVMKFDDREMLWADVRLRRSVAPFRNPNTRSPIPARPEMDSILSAAKSDVPEGKTTQRAEISLLVAHHWEVVSDGPSGVQLRAPRTLKALNVLCLVLGLACFALGFVSPIAYGIGLVLIILGLLHYYVLAVREVKFFPRPELEFCRAVFDRQI